jgi:hypothetical protein
MFLTEWIVSFMCFLCLGHAETTSEHIFGTTPAIFKIWMPHENSMGSSHRFLWFPCEKVAFELVETASKTPSGKTQWISSEERTHQT